MEYASLGSDFGSMGGAGAGAGGGAWICRPENSCSRSLGSRVICPVKLRVMGGVFIEFLGFAVGLLTDGLRCIIVRELNVA